MEEQICSSSIRTEAYDTGYREIKKKQDELVSGIRACEEPDGRVGAAERRSKKLYVAENEIADVVSVLDKDPGAEAGAEGERETSEVWRAFCTSVSSVRRRP